MHGSAPKTAQLPLRLEGVGLTLPSAAGPVEILKGVDLTIEPGERVAVVGPSGSGKSSLIAVAAGLERPTAGTVRLFGEDLARLDEDGRARLRRGRVSLVFQAFHLLPNMTAEENVAAPLEIARVPHAGRLAREWLERVGLAKRGHHYPHQLSGGEQQRVALARALAARPSLLFADEPTGNLDGKTAEAVAGLMFDLVAEAGAALVLVTHDAGLADRADRQVRMAEGRASS
jgi:putative ABC transport system ATP-binding protein